MNNIYHQAMKQVKSINIDLINPRYQRHHNQFQRQQYQRSLQQYSLSKPNEIATFSYDEKNNRFPPILNQFKEPTQLPMSLIEGYDPNTSPKQDNESPLTPILDTIISNNINVKGINFITYRNNLNKIMGMYTNSNPWTIDIECKNDIIHLGIVKDTNDIVDDFHGKSIYSGYKFEELSTIKETQLRYCSVVHTCLANQFNMIVAAEIDCYMNTTNPTAKTTTTTTKTNMDNLKRSINQGQEGETTYHQTNDRKYVELKTYRVLSTPKVINTFEKYKSFSFWLQSYIAGVETIVCGSRDDDFNLREIKYFNTHQLPNIGRKFWNPNECLYLGYQVLSFIKSNVVNNGRYILKFVHPEVILYKVEEEAAETSGEAGTEVNGEKEKKVKDKSILSNDYINWLNNKLNSNNNNSSNNNNNNPSSTTTTSSTKKQKVEE